MTATAIATADLNAIEALLAAGTPGPWRTGTGDHWCRDIRAGSDSPAFCGARNGPADAALIVAAVNALPGLLARLRAAEAERDALRAALVKYGIHDVDCDERPDVCSCGLDAAKGAAR